MTSLTFMLVCVPLPVCQMLSGKCSLPILPAATSSAAATMALPLRASSCPYFMLACAHTEHGTPQATGHTGLLSEERG